MTIDDAIALGRETLALEAAKTAAAQHDDAQHERLAEGFRQHCRTAAPPLAAVLVAIGPALVEWREAVRAHAMLAAAFDRGTRVSDGQMREAERRAQAAEQQAQADLKRTQTLAQQGFVSPTQQETAQLSLRQRQQELTMAEQDLQTALHDLQRLRIGLSQPAGKGNGTLLRVPAPVTARVLKLHRDSEGPIAAGAPILDLGDPGQLEIVTELLTEDAAALPTQARATLGHWGGQGRLRAVLTRVEPGAFTKVSALGVEEQRVKAVFDWQDAPPPGLGDGYKMEIRIVVQQASGVPLAPVSAVFPHGGGHAVFVVDGGRVRRQAVELLGRNGQQAWLRTELPEGTVLVSYPPATLREGDRVQPLKP